MIKHVLFCRFTFKLKGNQFEAVCNWRNISVEATGVTKRNAKQKAANKMVRVFSDEFEAYEKERQILASVVDKTENISISILKKSITKLMLIY